jgi:hypothetical protein
MKCHTFLLNSVPPYRGQETRCQHFKPGWLPGKLLLALASSVILASALDGARNLIL